MTQFVEAGPSFQLQDLILAPNTLSQCHFYLTNWFPTKVLSVIIFSISTRRWAWSYKDFTEVARKDNFSTTRAGDLGWAIIRETTRGYDGLRSEDPPLGTILREALTNQRPELRVLTNKKTGLEELTKLVSTSERVKKERRDILWHRQTIASFIRSVSFIEQWLSRTENSKGFLSFVPVL